MVTPYTSESVAVMVLASGSGERFGVSKQFFKIHGKQVLSHTVDVLIRFDIAQVIVVVVPLKRVVFVKKQYAFCPQVIVIAGGESRYESTKRGLMCLENNKDHRIKYVYIHDGVRPLVVRKNFTDLYKALKEDEADGAVLYLPVSDSLIEFRENFHDNEYLERKKIISLQTPHLYAINALWRCFSQYSGEEIENAQLMELCGKKLSYVLGSRENIKLTYVHDVPLLKKMLSL